MNRNGSPRFLSLIALTLLVPPLVSGSRALAEPAATPTVAVAQPTLPPATGAAAPVSIGKMNVVEHKESIMPDLYPLVRDGTLVVEAVSKSDYTWKLDQDAALAERPAGDKILQAIATRFASTKILSFDFDMREIRDNDWGDLFRGNLSRIYPHEVSAEDKTSQLFREKARFDEPSFLSGMTWLTFRFTDPEEDMLWIYSPAIQKMRQLTGSNRPDAILKTGVSLDDLLTWSGKAELLDTVDVSELTALAPLPKASLANTVREGGTGCVVLSGDKKAPAAKFQLSRWNVDAHRYGGAAPWVPTDSIWAPLALWRLELLSKDLYSLYGRQVLYIDAKLSLPIVKIVYDRAGRLWKYVITAYGLARLPESDQQIFYPAYTIIDDRIGNGSYVIDYTKVKYCDKPSEKLQLTEFEPRNLGPVKATETPAPKK